MRIDKNVIKKIITLRNLNEANRKFNNHYSVYTDAFKCVKFLYPLSTQRKVTSVNMGGGRVIVHKELREQGRYGRQSREIHDYDWLEHYCDPDNEAKIFEISKFVANKNKREDFIWVHKQLSKLFIRGKPNDTITIENDEIEPFEIFEYISSYYDRDEYSDNKCVTSMVKSIEYNGKDFYLVLNNKIRNNFDDDNDDDNDDEYEKRTLNLSTDEMTTINCIDFVYDVCIELMSAWKTAVDNIIETDKKIIYRARESVAKYEIMAKL